MSGPILGAMEVASSPSKRGERSWPPRLAEFRDDGFQLMLGEYHIEENIARLCENRGRLLFNCFELADDPPNPDLGVARDSLKIDRDPWWAAHHNRLPLEKADARKPPETPGLPPVDSASKYLTSDRNAAEMSAAWTMFRPWFALGPFGCSQHPDGPQVRTPSRVRQFSC